MGGIDDVLGSQRTPEQQARMLRAVFTSSTPSPGSSPQGAATSFPAKLALQLAMGKAGGEPVGVGPAQPLRKGPVVRISQLNPVEYDSPVQARTWGPVSCSAAALTSALRSFGVNVRIADVLKQMPGAVSLDVGLVSRSALVEAAKRFGVDAREDVSGYAELEKATAAGQPVLADLVSSRFPEGHWVVVTGAGPGGVQLADSSSFDLKTMSREELVASWTGRGIRLLGQRSQGNG